VDGIAAELVKAAVVVTATVWRVVGTVLLEAITLVVEATESTDTAVVEEIATDVSTVAVVEEKATEVELGMVLVITADVTTAEDPDADPAPHVATAPPGAV